MLRGTTQVERHFVASVLLQQCATSSCHQALGIRDRGLAVSGCRPEVMTGCLLVGASYALLNTQTHAVGAVAAVGVEDSKVRDLLSGYRGMPFESFVPRISEVHGFLQRSASSCGKQSPPGAGQQMSPKFRSAREDCASTAAYIVARSGRGDSGGLAARLASCWSVLTRRLWTWSSRWRTWSAGCRRWRRAWSTCRRC